MKRFSNILFVVSTDNDVSAAFERAVSMASDNQAKLTVLGVIDSAEEAKEVASSGNSELLDAMMKMRQEQLNDLVKGIASGGPQVDTRVVAGIGFIEIIQEVINNNRDLVIKSIEAAGGLDEVMFGSMDRKLLRKCPCPVWLIKSAQQQGFRGIMVGLDYDEENDEVDKLNGTLLEMASSLALAEFSELHVVHAWSLSHESFMRSPWARTSDEEVNEMVAEEEAIRRDWLAGIVKKHCSTAGKEAVDYLKPQIHLVKGEPRNAILSCAEEVGAELVLLGTVCRTGIPGFIIGNTAEELLNRVRTSVLAIKPAGFVSPVR